MGMGSEENSRTDRREVTESRNASDRDIISLGGYTVKSRGMRSFVDMGSLWYLGLKYGVDKSRGLECINVVNHVDGSSFRAPLENSVRQSLTLQTRGSQSSVLLLEIALPVGDVIVMITVLSGAGIIGI